MSSLYKSSWWSPQQLLFLLWHSPSFLTTQTHHAALLPWRSKCIMQPFFCNVQNVSRSPSPVTMQPLCGDQNASRSFSPVTIRMHHATLLPWPIKCIWKPFCGDQNASRSSSPVTIKMHHATLLLWPTICIIQPFSSGEPLAEYARAWIAWKLLQAGLITQTVRRNKIFSS